MSEECTDQSVSDALARKNALYRVFQVYSNNSVANSVAPSWGFLTLGRASFLKTGLVVQLILATANQSERSCGTSFTHSLNHSLAELLAR